MWSSAPTECVRVRIDVCGFVMSYRAGGVEPRPYGVNDRYYGFALVRSDLQLPAAREGQAPPLRYDENRISLRSGLACLTAAFYGNMVL